MCGHIEYQVIGAHEPIIHCESEQEGLERRCSMSGSIKSWNLRAVMIGEEITTTTVAGSVTQSCVECYAGDA